MAEPTSKIAIKLNRHYTAYLADPEKSREPLLIEVGRVAKRAFRDDDLAQTFVIMTWQSLPAIKDLPCTFGGWIYRRLQWRGIDYSRASQILRDREVQVPLIVDEDGISPSANDTLDRLYQATQGSFTEPLLKLETIGHPFCRRVAEDLLAGYTQDEIALRLGVNPSTLRSRLSRYRHSN